MVLMACMELAYFDWRLHVSKSQNDPSRNKGYDTADEEGLSRSEDVHQVPDQGCGEYLPNGVTSVRKPDTLRAAGRCDTGQRMLGGHCEVSCHSVKDEH